jgi:purine-nucleoside phosphorylase
MEKKLQQSLNSLHELFGTTIKVPKVCIVLGSGFSEYMDSLVQEKKVISYDAITNFTQPTIEGHSGTLVIGEISGIPVVVLNGRNHIYEGLPLDDIIFPVRLMAYWGVENFIITNSVGGVNSQFKPGDFMIIKDHVSFFIKSVLQGKNSDQLGVQFTDMSEPYSSRLMNIAQKTWNSSEESHIHTGIYTALTGPQYETKKEIEILKSLGIDAVGMSMIPEVMALNHMKKYKNTDESIQKRNIEVLGISFISNMGTGILDQEIQHEDVIDSTQRSSEILKVWLQEIVKKI